MAKTEKILFSLMVFLLALGLGLKVYKLTRPEPEFTLTHLPPDALKQDQSLPGKKARGAPKIVNLNAATMEELDGLPHVGKALAGRIVHSRAAHGPFQKKTDLLRVDGMTIGRYKKIEPYLTPQ